MIYLKSSLFQGFVFFVMFSLSQASSAFSYTIELTQRQLQEKIDGLMPLERKQYLVTVKLSEPKVALIESSNAVGLFLHMDVIVPGGLKGSGRGEIQGSIRFEKESGEFFLDNPALLNMEIDRLPKKLMPSISKAAQILLSNALAKYPVYRLKDDDAKHQLAKSTLKEIRVKGDKLLISLGIF